jgi:hypothetical protein
MTDLEEVVSRKEDDILNVTDTVSREEEDYILDIGVRISAGTPLAARRQLEVWLNRLIDDPYVLEVWADSPRKAEALETV